jgi:xylose isomerase
MQTVRDASAAEWRWEYDLVHTATWEQISDVIPRTVDQTAPLDLIVVDEGRLIDAKVRMEWEQANRVMKPRLMSGIATDVAAGVIGVITLGREHEHVHVHVHVHVHEHEHEHWGAQSVWW